MDELNPSHEADGVYDRMVELWALRLMVKAVNKHKAKVCEGHGIEEIEEYKFKWILELLDYKALLGSEANIPSIQSFLRQRLVALEQSLPAREGPLFRNLADLASHVGLNRIEEDLVAFALLLHEAPTMGACSEFLGSLSGWRVIRVLAATLGCTVSEVQVAVHQDSTLRKAGLLELPMRGP